MIRHTENFTLEIVYRRQRLKRALDWCGSDYHKIVVILYLLGYEQAEIAGFFDISQQAVSRMITRFCHYNNIAVTKGGRGGNYSI